MVQVNQVTLEQIIEKINGKNGYKHLKISQYLTGEITEEKVKKFYVNFGIYIIDEYDKELFNMMHHYFGCSGDDDDEEMERPEYVTLSYKFNNKHFRKIINRKDYCDKLILETKDSEGNIVLHDLLNIKAGNQVFLEDDAKLNSLVNDTCKIRIKLKYTLTSLEGLFDGCCLSSIPENLFVSNERVTDFSECFINCSELKSIPEKLFSVNTKVISFNSCFAHCTKLISIPEKLFTNNIKVENFGACFNNCVSLTSISENLFVNNTNVISFDSCFANCTGLTSIPENLFTNNTEVITFYRCFNYCIGLTSIPENIFITNTKVTDFGSCFAEIVNLTGTTPLNQNGSKLWKNKKIDGTECFKKCYKLDDFEEIPIGWY